MALQTYSNLESLVSIRTKINANATELYSWIGSGGTTGTGVNVLQTSPTLITPILGVARFTSLTTGTGSGGMVIYNTIDETTNYERLSILWSANIATISANSAGSANGRTLRLNATTGSGGSNSNLNITRNAAPYFNYTVGSLSSGGTYMQLWSGDSNIASSGIATFMSIVPTVNQTGTAGYVGLLINPTETAVGSGGGALLRLQVSGNSIMYVSNTLSTAVGIGTAAPTHPLTFASAANAGLALYNTVDQTTNLERIKLYASGNTYYLISESGGTGSSRDIAIGSTSNGGLGTPGTRTQWATDSITHLLRSSASATLVHTVSGGTNTATSGVFNISRVIGTINQSSTGGYTMFLINPTITATGSGLQLLQDWQVGGTSLAVMTSGGLMGFNTAAPTHSLTFGSTSSDIAAYNTVDQVTNYERARIQRSSNIFKIAIGAGGTGTSRSMRLLVNTNGTDADTNYAGIEITSANVIYTMRASPSSTTGHSFIIGGIGSTLSSSVLNFLSVTPAFIHTGTAGYNALYVNVTETSVGSGSKNLIWTGIGGVAKFTVDRDGVIKIGNTVAVAVAVASTHKVTIDIRGVTYYLLATT